MPGESKEAKEIIRARHRQRRAQMAPGEREAAGGRLAVNGLEWAQGMAAEEASTFGVYLGVGSEPPTVPLINALHGQGHKILLPVCEPDRHLSWVYWSPEVNFVRSRYAPILEPDGVRHGLDVMEGVAALVIPATALDKSGNRIGQGGGYYDVFLASLATRVPQLPLAAMIYDEELLPAGTIPSEEFDRKVPAALMPSGVVRLADTAS
ncbi:5-formyltetrahydrofolate cyclo-ligase [Arthrobacter sp. D1-29]